MAAAGGSRRRHSLDVPSSSRPLLRHHFSSNTNLSASANNGQGMQPLKEQDEVLVVSLSLYTLHHVPLLPLPPPPPLYSVSLGFPQRHEELQERRDAHLCLWQAGTGS